MTDRPTCTKPRTEAPGDCVGSSRTPSSASVEPTTGDSELTRRAREVLARPLTAKESFDLRLAAGTSASVPATYGVGRLEALGLVSVTATIGAGGHSRNGAGRLRDRGGRRALIAATDLGRECARLLALEVGRG